MPAAKNEILRNRPVRRAWLQYKFSEVLLINIKDLKIRELCHVNVCKTYCFKYAICPQIDAIQHNPNPSLGEKQWSNSESYIERRKAKNSKDILIE